MLLAIDIGNTSITLGVFENDTLVSMERIPSDKTLVSTEYQKLLCDILQQYNITGCIIASVVTELDEVIHNAVLGAFSIAPIHARPQEEKLGADRYVNVVAGKSLYPLPLIIVDLGTANTFDVINQNGEYLGGLISAGVNTQLKSLNLMTSKLPLISPQDSPTAIAYNTQDAILSGTIRGTACMISGMIEQTEAELGQKATVIATGGLANTVVKYMSRPFDDISPNLTLLGLKLIYEQELTLSH